MKLPKLKIRVVILLSILPILFLFGKPVFSSEGERLLEIRKQIAETEALLSDTRQKKATLQNEISYQENQIRLTILKIDETEAEIAALTNQIDRLEGVLSGLSEAFAERAFATYRLKRSGNPLFLLLTADNATQFIAKYHYLRRIQENDKVLLLQMQTTQTSYEDQRTKVQELAERLEAQKNQLARQKLQKENLLEVTKNDEKRFIEMLKTLQADEEAIRNALASVFQQILAGIKSGAAVEKGGPIGIEGNTGNSTGPHLHFMYMTCGDFSCVSDPTSILNKGGLDNGAEYRLPMDFPGGDWQRYETQGYGCTDFAARYTQWYGGKCFHNGRDLSLKGGNVVRAVSDGTVYYGVDGAGGKYALVKHREDFWSAYWHLQ